MIARAYFLACLALGWLLRSARYTQAPTVHQNAEPHVRKRRAFYAPLLIWMGALVVRILDTGQRVLTQREWEERERLIYQTVYGTSIQVESDGTLVLPYIAGRTLATVLEDPDQNELTRMKAIEAAALALAEFHRLGFTHADAMAENVLIDFVARPGSHPSKGSEWPELAEGQGRGSCQAHWFDFETVHDPNRPMVWRRADDLRALLSTCLIRTAPGKRAEIIQLIVNAYANEDVAGLLAQSITSEWRRSLAFHLAQAALSFESFREIGRMLREPGKVVY
jgi:hypothetical protein